MHDQMNEDKSIRAAAPDADRSDAMGLLNKLLQQEQRRRRWNMRFRAIKYATVIGLLLFLVAQAKFDLPEGMVQGIESQFYSPPLMATRPTAGVPHIAVVRLEDLIFSDSSASAPQVNRGLQDSFAHPETQAVIMLVNSPGGSVVHSGQIYDEIRRLRQSYPQIPLHAVVGDMALSGGYYVAAAADMIYTDRASLVGSIGVISGGFGFIGTMEKLGMERRLYTAGEHKALLDSFSPEKPDEIAFWQELLDESHRQFIDRVREGRGERLQEGSADLFSGLIWTGSQALGLGLIDGLKSVHDVAEELGDLPLVDFTRLPDFRNALLQFISHDVLHALLTRLNFSQNLALPN